METKLKKGKIYIDTEVLSSDSTFLKFIKEEGKSFYFKHIGGKKDYTENKNGLTGFSDDDFIYVSKKDLIKHIDYLTNK